MNTVAYDLKLIFLNYQQLNHEDKAKEATNILRFDISVNEGYVPWNTR